MPSYFAISTSGPLAPGTMLSGLQDNFPATQSISSLTSSSLSSANLSIKENSNEETSLGSSEHVPSSTTSFSIGTKGITGRVFLILLVQLCPSSEDFPVMLRE